MKGLVDNMRQQYEGKSKFKASILCWLLGFFGAHRFYVGKTKSAIAFLCTLGGLGIGVFIDGVAIMRETFTDSEGMPLYKDISLTIIIFFMICYFAIMCFGWFNLLKLFGVFG